MEKELKILMLEDIEEDAGLILRTLMREDFQFTHVRVDTREEFTRALLSFKPDVILSDHALPQFDSNEALKICRAMGLNIPFVLVTGTVSEEFAVTCLKLGADDYILKSNLARLPIAIRASLENRHHELLRVQQQEMLQKQNEELIKINRELDSFVYSVSHNLRSPLSSILGLVNVARIEGRKNIETIEQYFEMIEQSVFKLDDTLKEILDYSRNSRNELVIAKIDLEGIVNDAFDQLKYLDGQSKIKKEITIPNDTEFFSDNYRLSVILANLISNAIKYKDNAKEHPYIKVTASITTVQATIEVSDNGIGIKPEFLPHVQKMFYRATEISAGSGLGLYVVKEMVEKLKGAIDITSTYGEGTNVELTLPNITPSS